MLIKKSAVTFMHLITPSVLCVSGTFSRTRGNISKFPQNTPAHLGLNSNAGEGKGDFGQREFFIAPSIYKEKSLWNRRDLWQRSSYHGTHFLWP